MTRQQNDNQTAISHQLDIIKSPPLINGQESASSSLIMSSITNSMDSNSTKSDRSLEASVAAAAASTVANNNNNANMNHPPIKAANGQVKSPILIKYNYYDYNGTRQEQFNQDMNYRSENSNYRNDHQPQQPKIQRQLSPTFRQDLQQIVKNSQLHQQEQQFNHRQVNSPKTPPKSPEQHLLTLARRYKHSSYEQRCLRCNTTVYQMDKVGPLKDFTFYHQNCFKCLACGTKLTLKTYFNNQQSSDDQEVYCHRHCPKTGPGKLDNQSVGIRAALNAPKVFDSNMAATAALIAASGGPNANLSSVHHHMFPVAPTGAQLAAACAASANYHQQLNGNQPNGGAGNETMPVKPLHQVQDKKISQFISRRLEYLEPKQKLLEMRHREEEDALFKQFEAKWRQEESCISEQIRLEWRQELSKMLDKYTRELNSIQGGLRATSKPQMVSVSSSASTNQKLANGRQIDRRQPSDDATSPQVSDDHSNHHHNHNHNNNHHHQQQQRMIELERMNLEKTMTIKLDKKKETLKRKLKEFERQATAELVEKQSREMLALISTKLEEFKDEQKRKIGSEMEQFEAIESLANQLGSSLQLNGSRPTSGNKHAIKAPTSGQQRPARVSPTSNSANLVEVPKPRAPQISKMELYNNEQADEVFREIDQVAINVAREDQQTFTDLVHHLTRNCLSDIAKARAIFRWITVKNLNTMHFDSSIKADTPLGLLRGIKNGSESYHVLFKRLCSYAGLHCVVIKGYSKSAGYQPGVQFEGNRFRNSWNAVYVAGAWRFVQCNWGARHLVSVAVMQDKSKHSHQPETARAHAAPSSAIVAGRGSQQQHQQSSPNHGRRGQAASGSATSSPGSLNDASSPLTSRSSPQTLSQSLSVGADETGSRLCRNRRHHRAANSEASNSVRSAGSSSSGHSSLSDSLRYEYDDHYFLTDPDEFIYEFYPLMPEWQLIKTRPITLKEFEQLPFVRSLFFKYGLYFPQPDIRSVLYTDSSGAATIKIGMPTHMIPSLIFHYNLKHYNSELEEHDGVNLKRFVMQSVQSGDGLHNIVSFRIHLPEDGAYVLDIFANSIHPTQYITGEPMKFKSVCKFKIIAENLKTVMVPLPDCASGEYGPMKATRLFGIIPISHESGLITLHGGGGAGNEAKPRSLEIQFRMTRPLLDFMASLHKNGYDERQLSKAIKILIDGDIVVLKVKFPDEGQYGLDIYTRDQQQVLLAPKTDSVEPEARQRPLLTHCCKYLINVKANK